MNTSRHTGDEVPAGTKGARGASLAVRLLLALLALIVLSGLFMIAPPLALCIAGLWGVSLAFEIRKDARKRIAALEAAAADERAQLEARIEALSDEIFSLRERESRYRGMIDQQGDIVFRRDAEGLVSFVNDAFCRTFGVAGEKVLGKRFAFDVIEGEMAGGAPGRQGRSSYDVKLSTVHGPRWIAFEEVPVFDEAGRLSEIQSVGRDVTERQQAQESLKQARREAEAAASAKSRFLATMSHEIRTPLNGVLGMAGLMERTRLSPEQLAYLSAIQSSGEALLTLIDDILDFSRLDAGKVKLTLAPFDLGAMCEEVVELLAPKAHARSLEIGLTLDPATAGRVEGDASRLRQVLLNLIGNAVKFTESGGVRVHVCRPQGGPVEITVSDTGPGIPEDAIKDIFKEFEQVEQGPARRYGGTGLGLAISSRLIRLMGGRIRAENLPGGGAKFSVRLPLEPVAPLAAPPPQEASLPRVLLWTTLGQENKAWRESLEARGFTVDDLAGFDEPSDPAALSRADVVIFDTFVLSRHAGILERMAARRIVALRPDERGEVLPHQSALPVDGFLIRPVRLEAFMQLLLPERSQALTSTLKAPRLSLASARVLVAEDNDINALLTEKLLENMGCEAVRAADGLEAVEAASQGGFDLILMDLHMPHMDGLEAAAMIAAQHQGLGENVPIVALTANAGSEDRERSFAAGMVDFLVKPVSPDTLRSILARWVWEKGLTSPRSERGGGSA